MTEEDFDIEHHKKITAQRNFDKVYFGDWEIKTWSVRFVPVAFIKTSSGTFPPILSQKTKILAMQMLVPLPLLPSNLPVSAFVLLHIKGRPTSLLLVSVVAMARETLLFGFASSV